MSLWKDKLDELSHRVLCRVLLLTGISCVTAKSQVPRGRAPVLSQPLGPAPYL